VRQNGRRCVIREHCRKAGGPDAIPSLNGNGTLFGLAVAPDGAGVYFVDDGANTLNLLH
jgi:hypothetical protein